MDTKPFDTKRISDNIIIKKAGNKAYNVFMDTEGDIEVVFVSCLHVGAAEHDRELFIKYRDWVLEKPNRYVITLGDLGDYSLPTHISQTMWKQDTLPEKQIYDIVELFKPIKDRILAMYDGNHENRIWKKTSLNPGRIIAQMLDAPWMGYGGYLTVMLGLHSYRFFLIHGERGGQPEYGLRVAIERGWGAAADITVMGHLHCFAYKDFYRNELHASGTYEMVRKTGVRTASFQRDPDYAFKKMYEPSICGASIIKLYKNQKHWDVDNSGELKFGREENS